MRRAAKVDANQAEIVDALRAAGARVQSLAGVGEGCPDLLVGFADQLLLMEVKDGGKVPSQRKLTPDQVRWHEAWDGYPVYIITDVEQALKAVGK